MTIGHKPLQEGEGLDVQYHLPWLASPCRRTGQRQKQQSLVEADSLKLLQLLLCSKNLMDIIKADCTTVSTKDKGFIGLPAKRKKVFTQTPTTHGNTVQRFIFGD